MMDMGSFRVGTSGWSYDHWEGKFYPHVLPKTKRLAFYAENFDTVEINSSFYHLPRETTFHGWREGTPDGFVFAVKGSRYITHVKKLVDVDEPIFNLAKRARHLKEKLGPVLWQLPPQVRRNDERLEGFLELLPRDLSHVVEFRHDSWFCDEIYDALDRSGVSFCCVSSPEFVTDVLTTGSVGYLRMHGEGGWYSSKYTPGQLRSWASKISRGFSRCREGYVYFNNDANAFAVANARDLRSLLDEF